MTKLQKYSYQLKTLSKVILSPRQQQAFYNGIDFTDTDIKAANKEPGLEAKSITIIYPFYQRGEYEAFKGRSSRYYFPGSSIKGALLSEENKALAAPELLVDDVALNYEDIQLSQLNKVQGDESEGKVKLEKFFPKVAIEMCQANVIKTGEMFSSKTPAEYFEREHQYTLEKLEQWTKKVEQLVAIIEESGKKKNSEQLIQAIEQVRNLKTNRSKDAYWTILGGYKGLFLSRTFSSTVMEEALQSGFFIDEAAVLPYGLVEVSGIQKNE